MEETAAFRDRFREARKKRAQDRGSLLTKATAKRHRQTAATDAASSPEAASTSALPPESGLTKEERDRILMPPPPSLKRTRQPSPPTVAPQLPVAPLPSAPPMSEALTSNGSTSGVPEGFFELEEKAAKEQLEKERLEERTDAEYARFMIELEDSLVTLSQEEALEEEQSQQHRQESEAYEQEQRLKTIQEIKSKREQRPIPVRAPSSDAVTSSSESDEEDTIELQWRQKAL